jgi:hypothetical protein
MSGFGNTAHGGITLDGAISGFFNTGAPGVMFPFLSGEVSGLLNTGSQISGLFSLANLFT